MSKFTIGQDLAYTYGGQTERVSFRQYKTATLVEVFGSRGSINVNPENLRPWSESETLAKVTGSTEATVIHERVDYSSGSRGEVTEVSRSHFRATASGGTVTTDNPMDSVVAEDAPIGVQLWPTHSPEQAPNFTLMEVRIVRRENRGYVTWVYENGNERHFDMGERVAVRFPEPEAPVEHVTEAEPIFCKFCGSGITREAGLWVDVVSGDEGGTYDHCDVNWIGHVHRPQGTVERVRNMAHELPKR